MSIPLDSQFMAKAIQLAKRGLYTTDPNPRVGCVLVKNGEILAEGWHARAGEGHAEIQALAKTSDARNCTAYITLEPCSHYGKTPPCCDALIRAGVKKVVAAMEDPNPLVAGQGLDRLRDAGIDVKSGVLEAEAKALNPGFIKRMQTGLPYLTSKIAMSLDGRTALASGVSHWITSKPARIDVHRMRAASSAIMTGINTVLMDDPRLNARLNGATEVLQPARIILDSRLRMPYRVKMLTTPGQCFILTSVNQPEKQRRLEDSGFVVIQLPADDAGRVRLQEVLRFLGRQAFNEVLLEAGSILNGAFLTRNLIDRWIIYMAPSVLGDLGRGLFKLPELKKMTDKKSLVLTEMRKIGPDLRLKFIPRI